MYTRRHMVSIIIPVYNQLPYLMKCINSLMATVTPADAEIILIDDCSPEFNLTEIMGAPMQVYRNEQNKGFAGTCNTGALKAKGELLFFLNSDTIAQPNWLAPMVKALAENDTLGIVGPKLLFPDGNIQSCGGLFDGGRGPYHRFLGMDGGYHLANRPEVVSWITGAALMIRAGLFHKLGGFDEGYKRGYFEDVDLCCRAKVAGFDTWYEPRAVLTHHVGTSTAGKTPEQMREAAKQFKANSWRFHARWDANIVPDTQNIHVNY